MSLISATTRAALEELLETSIRPVPQHWLGIRYGIHIIGYIQPDYVPAIERYIEETETNALVRFGDSSPKSRIKRFG